MDYTVYTSQDLKTKKIRYQPGDIWLGKGHSLQDKFIQLVTGCPFNHAALIVDKDGSSIELVTHNGIRKTNIDQEREDRFYIIRIDMSPADRKHVLDFAYSRLEQKSSYDFLGLISITMNILFKIPLVFKIDGQLMCSEFVADALAQGGVIWDKDPALISPKDLFDKFVSQNNGCKDL